MSLSTLSNIQKLLPEVSPLIKKADIDTDFSTRDMVNTVVSNLKMEYLTKVARTAVDQTTEDRLRMAAELYGVQNQISLYSSELVKRASSVNYQKDLAKDVRLAEAYLEGKLSGFSPNITKIAEEAESIYDSYSEMVTSPTLKRYAGEAFLNKTAAVNSLRRRTQVTNNKAFEKLAQIVDATRPETLDSDDIRLICRAVTHLDKKAGLDIKGYNFYNEALMEKSASVTSLSVTLAGKPYPVESILALGPRLGQALGEDVAKEIGSDPVNAKVVIEALPRDLQQLLASLL